MDLLTSPYVFNVEEGKNMTKAGADLIVAHMGLTSSGTIGARTTKTLEKCVRDVQLIIDTCKSIRSDVMVLCHGGPIASPKDAQFLFNNCTALDGFYGASSMERLPTEHAITEEIRKFAGLKLRADEKDGHAETTGTSGDGQRTHSLSSPRLGSVS